MLPILRRTTLVHSRLVHRTPPSLSSDSKPAPSHSPDTYSKDVDTTPPADPKVHRVDPDSENAQKPYEPPQGPWSEAGTRHGAYQSMSETHPYNLKGKDQRYGGMEQYDKQKGPETSHPGAGPEGVAQGGRKPERG